MLNFVRKVMDDYSDLGHILWVVFKSVFKLLFIAAAIPVIMFFGLLHIQFIAFTGFFIFMVAVVIIALRGD